MIRAKDIRTLTAANFQTRNCGLQDFPAKILAQQAGEQGIPRTAKGVKSRVARLKALGNAVVPQVAEQIGRLLIGGV